MLTQKYMLLVLLPGSFFLIVLGGDFLSMWMGPEVDGLALMLAILTVGHLIRLSQYSSFLVLVGKGEHKIFSFLAVSVAVVAMLLAVFAVRVLNLGLMGVVIANVIPMVIAYGALLPLYYCRKMGIRVLDVIRSVLVPALTGSLPACSHRVMANLSAVALLGVPADHDRKCDWRMACQRLDSRADEEERSRFLRIMRRATP